MIALNDLRDCVEEAYYYVCEKSAPFDYFPDGYHLDIVPWITFDFDTYHEDCENVHIRPMYKGIHENEDFYKSLLEEFDNVAKAWSLKKRAYIGGVSIYVVKLEGEFHFNEWDSSKDYQKTIKISGNVKVKEF